MSDSNLVDLSKVIGDKKQKEAMKKLDAQASYASIETCLTYLQLNKLEGLDKLKDEMKKTLKMLAEMGK
jgi:hypothetical protein